MKLELIREEKTVAFAERDRKDRHYVTLFRQTTDANGRVRTRGGILNCRDEAEAKRVAQLFS